MPTPCPQKSTAIVSRELVSVRGSTVTSTVARMGPSIPRTPHVRSASMWVSSEVAARLAPPMRRVVNALRARLHGAGSGQVTVDDTLLPFAEAAGSVA